MIYLCKDMIEITMSSKKRIHWYAMFFGFRAFNIFIPFPLWFKPPKIIIVHHIYNPELIIPCLMHEVLHIALKKISNEACEKFDNIDNFKRHRVGLHRVD
jgi:hypothetical protein